MSDNFSATYIAQNLVCHTKLKPVAIVHERTDGGTLKVEHILGAQQKAGVLTKTLRPRLFQKVRDKLVEVLPQVWGGMLVDS